MQETTESLLKFPCSFPIKAMGKAVADFDALVVSIIRRHAPDFNDASIESRLSKGGQYISITITINAQSQQQLDNIYQDLTDNEYILVAL